jgi:hypothetical protein
MCPSSNFSFHFRFARSDVVDIPESPKGERTDSVRFVDERSTADQPRPRVGHLAKQVLSKKSQAMGLPELVADFV